MTDAPANVPQQQHRSLPSPVHVSLPTSQMQTTYPYHLSAPQGPLPAPPLPATAHIHPSMVVSLPRLRAMNAIAAMQHQQHQQEQQYQQHHQEEHLPSPSPSHSQPPAVSYLTGSMYPQIPITIPYSTTQLLNTPGSTHMPELFSAPSARGFSKYANSTPKFPVYQTSMDSSASKAAQPSSAASSTKILSPLKPSTGTDTETYSCTYHNCEQRFSTPQKLQKHKRDVHRTTSNVTPGVGSGMSPQELMERNSQPGPHKCERINPGTGKPCNAIFSWSYDLTRHEDTIHNTCKQKSRCELRTEEKTYSRSDALTRHMRAVHPEVDFPGKHRRAIGPE
jgi:hypothetical protein